MEDLSETLIPTARISDRKESVPALKNLLNILWPKKEKELLNKIFLGINRKKIVQNSYFLYNHSNLVKKSFKIKLNIYIFLICSTISYLGGKKDALVNIISPKNRLEFLMEKLLYKETLTLQLTKVSGEKADIIDKKTIICHYLQQKNQQ